MKCFFALTMFFVSVAFSQEASIQFEQGNELYRNGDFKKAAEVYEQIIQNGYESPAVYFNLGNVYFKMSNIPSAILNYERAKRMAPYDEDISYNVRLAGLRIVDKIEPIPQLFFIDWWRSITNSFAADTWGMILVAALWLTVIMGAVFFLVRSFLIQRLSLLLGVIFLGAGILSFVWMQQRVYQEQEQKNAVIFSPSVSAKSAPDQQSTDLFVLHEGLKVELLDNVGEWKKIRLADGKVGWLLANSVQII